MGNLALVEEMDLNQKQGQRGSERPSGNFETAGKNMETVWKFTRILKEGKAKDSGERR